MAVFRASFCAALLVSWCVCGTPGSAAAQVGGVRVHVLDARGQSLGLRSSWVSLSRVVPDELGGDETTAPGEVSDADAVRFLVVGAARDLPSELELRSEVNGRLRDSLRNVAVHDVACPRDIVSAGPEASSASCRVTPAVRVVGDSADRFHPAVAARSILGEVGGRLRIASPAAAELSLPIGGPRQLEADGPGRYRARLRARILRMSPGGRPAIGTNDAEAKDLVLAEVALASQVWGQCGIHFGPAAELDVAVVDPPTTSLLSVGCDHGLVASGGEIALRVDGQAVRLRTSAGQTPVAVAGRLTDLLMQRGLRVERFLNPRTDGAALPTVDLRVFDKRGRLLTIDAGGASGLSTDASLGVCVADLNLEDGVDHFTDGNAAAGTLEERALLRGLMDDDPTTIDLLVVPIFSGLGRIGESFIFTPRASLQNALILDRGGIRASTRSFTLAHELGHILLDMPGHPDDYGVDRPSSLMDADAADGTIFGPRRLSLADCQRALRQSGPRAPVPLLRPWPLLESMPPLPR